MRAAQMKERPSFSLMKQTDVQTIYHMQMPRWLFSDPRYADMSLDAKVTYTFLLNRFQLSRRNGWVNDYGEVFVIFPRKELARELRICKQRVTAAFKKLVELKLVWEKRCGRGDANQIYLASVEPLDNPGYTSAPFVPEPDGDSRTAESEGLDRTGIPAPTQEPQDLSGKNPQNCSPRTAESAVAEPQKMRPSYIKSSQTDFSHTDVSQPVPGAGTDRRTMRKSSSCPDFQYVGTELWGMRYCKGFPKKKKPKRFKSSDPKYKAPKWCPRRISPSVCRIYDFANEQSRELDILPRNRFDPKRDQYIYLSSSHYKLRLEKVLDINAKTFFDRSKHSGLDDFLVETDLSLGEVVEIDDGLRPYYFYYWNWSKFIPVLIFDRSCVQK